MSNRFFNANMTSDEARTVLFTAVEGKTKKEIEEIKAEYSKVSSVIMKREFKLAEKGWMLG